MTAPFVEFAKKVGIVFGSIIATATVLGWIYAHTAGPIVAEVHSNTLAQRQIVLRLEAMEKRQDKWEEMHPKGVGP